MTRRNRIRELTFAAVLIGAVLAAPALFAATAGATVQERRFANELIKRLKENKTPSKVAVSFGRVYLRRAYLLQVGPAEALAKEVLRTDHRLKTDDQLKYFAWSLDALTRGAKLADLKYTLDKVLQASYNKSDRAAFLEGFLGNASRYASPVPLVDLIEDAGDNGVVGKRRREFAMWCIGLMEKGENPLYLKQMYDVLPEVTASFKEQRAFLDKCYDAVSRGAPPRQLATVVVRLADKFQTRKLLDEKLDKVLSLFFEGTPLPKALDVVIPPPPPKKKPAVD